MNSDDRHKLVVPLHTMRKLTAGCGGFPLLETLYLLQRCVLSLTLTELPVLGDHLAIAADAAAGVGAKAVTAAAFSFTRVFLTFIYICKSDSR